MGKAAAKRASVVAGHKTGTKRGDRHWTGPDGSKWDSRFEYIFYTIAKDSGLPIERCDASDTLAFTLPIRGGSCTACGSTEVGQQRRYTPDFRLVSADTEHKAVYRYIETKGYLRAKERSLLRNLYKAHPDISLCIILQRSYRATRPGPRTDGSIVSWFAKFLPNVKVYLWEGKVPDGMVGSLDRKGKSPRAGTVGRANRKSNKRAVTAAV